MKDRSGTEINRVLARNMAEVECAYVGAGKSTGDGGKSSPISKRLTGRKRKMSNRQSSYQNPYVACAIDTEGSLLFFKRKESDNPVCRIAIYNTNLPFLQTLRDILGTGSINEGPTGVGFRKLGCYCLRVGRRIDVLSILRQIRPYLIIKRDNCDRIISWLEENQTQAALSTLVGRGMVSMDVSGFPPKYYRDGV